jgi:CubicO group peptidase (beta-lactamase class C family)
MRSTSNSLPLLVVLSLLAACSSATETPSADGGEAPPGGDGGGADDEPPVPACATDLAAELDQLRVPGVSAGIIAGGRLVCTAVAGQADIEAGRAVVPDTVFAWASVSKTVAATAAMMLVEEGAIDLDADVDQYLTFPVDNPNCPDDPITVRQLLTHTSSIRDNGVIYDRSYVIGDSPIALGDFVRGYLVPGGDYYDADRNFKTDCPGEVNVYSNIAVGLLGHVVEEVSGTSFEEFCRQRIFAPLEMDQTSFRLADLDVDGVAMPYDGRDTFRPHGHNGFPTISDGLLRTSVPHLARFLAMFAELGVYRGQRLLSEATASEMRRVQIPDLDDTQALIWYYDDYGDRSDLLGHDGDDPGTASLMFFDPETGDGALLVANGIWVQAEANALLGILFAEATDY